MRNTCTIDNCQKVRFGHGMCSMHYTRWRNNGDPRSVQFIVGDDLARFHSKTSPSDGGCIQWNGTINRHGYGTVSMGGTMVLAHRWIYEQERGPIPIGLDIDHLCRNRACVNPDHMEPVTRRENTMRGNSPTAINAKKTHCPQGHPYSGGNLYRGTKGQRYCRECGREHQRKYLSRKRRGAEAPF